MAKTKQDKKDLLESYNLNIAGSKGFIVLKPNKLTPNQANDFRKEVFDFESGLRVVKNSIFKRSLESNNIELPIDKGEYAVVFLKEDIVSPSKSLKKFIEKYKLETGEEKFEIVSGYLEGAVLTREQVTELSDMPDFEGSISMILGILDSAISGVIYVLEDAPRSIASVVDQAFKE